MYIVIIFFFIKCALAHSHLHSFPTRRSSDLSAGQGRRAAICWGRQASELRQRPICLGPAWKQSRAAGRRGRRTADRKSTRLNSSHSSISYAVFCLKKKTK